MRLTNKISGIRIAEMLGGCILLTLSLIFTPNASIPLLVVFILSYFMVSASYSYSTLHHKLGQWVLFSVTMLLSVGIIFNLWYFTSYSGGTLESPILHNADASRLFKCALSFYNTGSGIPDVPYSAFPFVVGMLWRVTGVNILVPLLLNFILTLIAILLSGAISIRLLNSKISYSEIPLAGSLAMLKTGACCYYIGCGTVILKEPSIYVGVGLILLVFARFMNEEADSRISIKDLIFFAVGTSILAFNRIGFLYIVLVGLILFITKRQLKMILVLSVILITFIGLGYMVSHNGPSRDINIISGGPAMEYNYLDDTPNSSHAAFNKEMQGYFDSSVWEKISDLPYTMSVQYFVPFPWNFRNSIEFGPSQAYSHMGFSWYCVGGIMFFFFLYSWRYTPRIKLGRWSLFCLVSFMVPAYLFAGAVSRYWLPFIPAYVSIATYVCIRLKEGQGRKPFFFWSLSYGLIVTMVLITCYYITT